jgi:pyruvate dehydrogenase E2 component (dihydrolipoamide acetyltransferase)
MDVMGTVSEPLEVLVPDIGDFAEVPIIEILVSVGDTVAAEDPLVTLESDKATMDVPAPAAGVVRELLVAVGDKVAEGSPLLRLEPTRASAAAASEPASAADTEQAAATSFGDASPAGTGSGGEVVPAPPADPPSARPDARDTPEAPPPATPAASPTLSGPGGVYASPSVRRLARELGVDLARVSGTGRKGRITVDDVRRGQSNGARVDFSDVYAEKSTRGLDLAPWPTVDFEKFGPVERVPRSRIQRISAPNLARNWVMIPHVTQNDEADITELEAWRKQLNTELATDGVKVTMVSFLIAASVATLKAFPDFNASLDGEELVLKRYYNIGFAADTPGGLVVPVIKHADQKGLLDIARELTTLAAKAREGKLLPGDMSGGTFTISSLGGIGGTSFTPIINAPEVAILGVTRAAMKPVWNGRTESFEPRLMLPLSLSYDHRVIDGAAAARFVVHLTGVLSDLRRALL